MLPSVVTCCSKSGHQGRACLVRTKKKLHNGVRGILTLVSGTGSRTHQGAPSKESTPWSKLPSCKFACKNSTELMSRRIATAKERAKSRRRSVYHAQASGCSAMP
eukprot:3542921-Amphidinium_carterae.1